MKDKTNGYSLTSDFIREYEEYMESIRDFEYGELYKIEVTLNNAGVEAGVMGSIEKARGMEPGFFIHDEKNLVFIAEISHDDEGVHEVIITMDHALNGGEYGMYTWKCLKV